MEWKSSVMSRTWRAEKKAAVVSTYLALTRVG
jgi:hypothetical protein